MEQTILLLSLFLIFKGCFFQDVVLNAPQILLPYVLKNSAPTTYTLRASKGCFKWTSTKPFVAIATPFDAKSNTTLHEDQCSTAALITVTQKSPDDDSTVILAEEEGTGISLKCNVFVDSITKIEIATTTRRLFIGMSPEVFEVFAYDAEGNMFTTLGSQSYEWSTSSVNTKDFRTILRFLWFQDSLYETTQEIYSLEAQRLRGCEILVEGINTGEAVISARLSHPAYKSVEPSQVNVVVVDNILILPTLSYIMIHQVVHYKASQLRSSQRKDFKLPSEQYTIDALNKTVVDLRVSDASVFGLALGKTKVHLIDKNMVDASSVKRPTANVYVVEPGKLGFAISPGRYWVLQTGKQYQIQVQLFDVDNNQILITDETIFDSDLSTEYFDIHLKSANGSYFFVTAKRPGKTLLTSTLDSIHYPKTNETFSLTSLFGEQSIEIYNPLMLDPKMVIFPWDPSNGASQGYQYQFKAVGGSGNYIWTTSNASVSTVNKKGIVTTHSKIGTTLVKVSDARNPTFTNSSTLKVLPPDELKFIPQHLEVEIGNVIELPISVSAFLDEEKKTKVEFTDCRKLNIQIRFQDSNSQDLLILAQEDIEARLPGQGCTTITLKGLNVGHTKVTATYQYGGISIQDSIHIAVYKPVKVIDPIKFATVAIGSTKRIIAEGGPLPWVLDPIHHYEVMSAEEEDWVLIKPSGKETGQGDNLHYFDVTCKVLGEQLLTVEVGNKPSKSLQKPAVSSAKTKFSCVPPATISLIPSIAFPLIDGTRKTIESCKDDQKRIPVRNNQELKIHLKVYDSSGNEFDDASSLVVKWSSDKLNVGQFTQDTKYEYSPVDHVNRRNGGTKIYQILQLHDKSETLVIQATVEKILDEIEVKPRISTSLKLIPLYTAIVQPSTLNLYAHPSNKADLGVSNGSGQFVLKSNDDRLSKVLYTPPNLITITPQRKGSLVLRLFDACLDVTDPFEVRVGLHDADGIYLTVKDKVEIGKAIQAKCSVIDAHQRELKIDANAELRLSLRSTTDILTIKSLGESVIQKGEMSYKLTGKTVGLTNLYCHATKISGKELNSAQKEVQVFSAIRLEPRHIVLIVGSVFQIYSQGGPRPHSTTVYSVENRTVADVSNAGLITAEVVGKTKVIGEAKGHDLETGSDMVYSSDVVIVEVIRISGFKISLKSRNIINDAQIGLLAVGINDEGPFTFASSPPFLQFHWSSSNHKSAAIESLHSEAGVSIGSEKDFRAVIKTSNPGHSTVKLKVEVLNGIQTAQYAKLEDEVQVQVYEKLVVLEPSGDRLLIPPNVYTKIKTNRDHLSHITYTLLSSSCQKKQSEGAHKSNDVISVSSTGVITSHSSSGSAIILVTVHEDFGFNQTALLEVEVKPIASITLKSLSNFVVVGATVRPAFPIGSTVLFGVTLHDNMGRRFDVSSVPVQYRTNRDDIVDILPNTENGTIVLRTTNVGETILKVWDKENHLVSDYIRIKVADGIAPIKTIVPLGSMVCYQSKVNTVKEGQWSVTGNSFTIDSISGGGLATAVGSSMIYFTSQGFTTHTEVTVTTPTIEPSVNVEQSYLFISNADEEKTFSISTDYEKLMNDLVNSCSKTSLNENIVVPYKCLASWSDNQDAVPLSQIFAVKSKYVNGLPVCVFKLNQLSNEFRMRLSVHNDRLIHLSVTLSDRVSRTEWTSQRSTQIRFTPDVYVSTKTLTLTKSQPSKTIDVLGSAAQLSSLKLSFQKNVQVTKIITDDTSKQMYQITASSISPSDITSSVKFYSPLTKTTHVVEVTLQGSGGISEKLCPVLTTGGKEAPQTFSIRGLLYNLLGDSGLLIILYTIVIATIILVLVLYHFYMKTKQQPVVIHSPYVHSPYAHHPHSPPPYQVGSPSPGHTPMYRANKETPTRLFSVSQ